MREIRLYGSEGGGAARSPYPYRSILPTFNPSQRPRSSPREGEAPAETF